MATEEGLNRISLRVPAELFQELDDKRHRERTTFQEIGLRLLQQWVDGGAKVQPPDDSLIDQIRKVLPTLCKDHIEVLWMLVQMLAENASHRQSF